MIQIKLTKKELQIILANHFNDKLTLQIQPDDVKFLVKSKQNYKAEWENADIQTTELKVEISL